MDMNKEKNAYEKHLLSQGADFMYLPNIQFNELENIYEMIEWDGEYDDALNELNSSWCTWQAAKASAVPDGFKVVPINYECAWCGCTELGGFSDEAMIEAAQGQDHESN